jgi:hypothetical protein
VAPSEAYDALCFLNPLLGDPFYERYYPADAARFRAALDPAAMEALRALDALRRSNGIIVSAALTNLFSAAQPATLADDVMLARDPERLLAAVDREMGGLDDASRQLVGVALPLVAPVLEGLAEAGFDVHWREAVRPGLEQDARRLAGELPAYDVVPPVEAVLGRALQSHTVTVVDAFYTRPHGIRITGTRFIQEPGMSTEDIVRTAVHELLHGILGEVDPATLDAFRRVGQDPFVAEHVRGHDPNYGYNTLDALLEEDTVRALEQRVSAQLGVARPLPSRFRSDEDDGMHVLAGALYALMAQEGFEPSGGEAFPTFLARMLASGRLAPGKTEVLYQAFLTMD